MFIHSIVLFLYFLVVIHGPKAISHFAPPKNKNEAINAERKWLRNGEKLQFDDQTIRSLRVSSSNFEPFLYQDDHEQFYNGIEYKLLNTIAEKFHLNLSFKPHFKRSNYNPLILNESDVIVGGLYPNRVSFDLVSVSKPYYQDDFMWCVQRAKNITWLFNFLLLATPECWLIYFGMGYTTGFLLYLMIQFDLEYKHRNQRDWHYTTLLIAFPNVIGINQRYQPKHFLLRLIYGYMLFMLMLAWQRIFFYGLRFLKYPLQFHQPSTIAEIVDQEFRLAGSADVLDLMRFDERYKRSQIDSFFVCPNIDDCLDYLKNDGNGDLAVGGSRQRILNSHSYLPSTTFCFDRDEIIASYQPALLMRKDFDFKQKVDTTIQNAFECGLFAKWDRDSQRKKERLMPFIPPEELTLWNVSHVFVFALFCGLFISIAAFASELIIHRKLKQPQRSWIWKYLEHFFDGDRHYLKNLAQRLAKGKTTRSKKIKKVSRFATLKEYI